MKMRVLRVIDANLNRAREGLRVCEEVARFVSDNKALTKELKSARHRIQNICKSFPDEWRGVIAARDSRADVGRRNFTPEMNRGGASGIFSANMQRSKESMRVLEEFSKLIDHKLSGRFKRLRFDLYEIEKRAASRL